MYDIKLHKIFRKIECLFQFMLVWGYKRSDIMQRILFRCIRNMKISSVHEMICEMHCMKCKKLFMSSFTYHMQVSVITHIPLAFPDSSCIICIIINDLLYLEDLMNDFIKVYRIGGKNSDHNLLLPSGILSTNELLNKGTQS